jgi:hypothetical protein
MENAEVPDVLLRAEDAAKLLHISTSQLYRRNRDGGLPGTSYLHGRRGLRIPAVSLVEFARRDGGEVAARRMATRLRECFGDPE